MCYKACARTGTLFPRAHVQKLGSMNLVCGWALRDLSHLKLQAQLCVPSHLCTSLGRVSKTVLSLRRLCDTTKLINHSPRSLMEVPHFFITQCGAQDQSLQTDHLSLKHSSATCFSMTMSKFLTLSMPQFPHMKNEESLLVVLRVNLVNTDKISRAVPGTKINSDMI